MPARLSGYGSIPGRVMVTGDSVRFFKGTTELASIEDNGGIPRVNVPAGQVYAGYAGTALVSLNGGLYVGTSAQVIGDITAAGGFRSLVGPWMRDNVAANLAAQQMGLGATGNLQTKLHAHRSGSVVGIVGKLTNLAAGAALTLQAYLNDVAIAGCTVNIAVGDTAARVTFAKDLYAFSSGGDLDLRVTTPAGWTGTTLELVCWLELEI